MCRWAAPEQLQERPRISKAVDVFAFGVIMWELIALKIPHSGLNVGSVVSRILSGQREEIPRSCPGPIADIIRSCWAQEPSDRPQTSDLAEDLMRIELVVE